MALVNANKRALEEGLGILSLRTSNNNLDSMQVKKETLKAAPLEVEEVFA